ncbi:hypothetical protein N7490_001782 [Penicillium lividum]|nr:hypothetical protein N7490_001782 [Penicillium lividum]
MDGFVCLAGTTATEYALSPSEIFEMEVTSAETPDALPPGPSSETLDVLLPSPEKRQRSRASDESDDDDESDNFVPSPPK